MDKLNIGRTIYQARNERKMTVAAVAEICGINDVYLRQIESGVKTPSLPVFVDICNALRVSPDYLLKDVLGDHEITQIQELDALWRSASLERQHTAAVMIRALLEEGTN